MEQTRPMPLRSPLSMLDPQLPIGVHSGGPCDRRPRLNRPKVFVLCHRRARFNVHPFIEELSMSFESLPALLRALELHNKTARNDVSTSKRGTRLSAILT